MSVSVDIRPTAPAVAPATPAAPLRVHVLDEDPDLGAGLSDDRHAAARADLVARLEVQRPGSVRERRVLEGTSASLGMLILDGVMTRELLIEDTVSAELLGPGDLIRPWISPQSARFVRSQTRWTVLEPARLAVLGPRFTATLVRYPEINAALLDRITERTHRVAALQAISHLNGVDRRVLALFWHLAERWGRVTAAGVTLSLPMPHRIIADLIGARRPTVSTAISRLVADGSLERRPGRAWLLRGDPVGLPTDETKRVVRFRRSPAVPEPDPLRAQLVPQYS